jgi:hypothetical protein
LRFSETTPASAQVTIDAYLAAAAAHERAAEAARRAAEIASALWARVPAPGEALDGAGRPDGTPAVASGGAPPIPGTDRTAIPATGPARMADSGPALLTGAGAAEIGGPEAGAWPGELLSVLVRRLPAGDLALASLSEAELAAATGAGPGEQRLVPLPNLDALPAMDRQAALTAGRYSLADRGLLAAGGAPGWALAALLALRARPLAVTIAVPEEHAAPHHYLYGTIGGAVLEEIVEVTGMHHFTLRTAASACALLARLADPYGRAQDTVPADGTVAGGMRTGWPDIHTAVGRAERITRISTSRLGQAGTHWLFVRLFAGPDGLLAIASREAGLTGDQAPNARWLSAWTLYRLLLAFLDATPAAAAQAAR